MSASQGQASMKRRRTDSTSEADYLKVFQGVMVEKDDEVWLEDGNVILIAERVAFKVYQGLLARRSEVFRDMFTLPGGPAETEKIDGVPVVSVSDPVVDLRHLLLVLCCGKNYFTQRDSADIEFSVVAALVRLGHKYAIQDLLDDALSSLRKLYPSSFLKYTLQQDWGSHASPRDAITAIHLARLTNTPSILPAAFLVCTTLGVELFQPEGGSGTTPLLPADLVRILNGKAALARESAIQVVVALKSMAESKPCPIGGCDEVLDTILRE